MSMIQENEQTGDRLVFNTDLNAPKNQPEVVQEVKKKTVRRALNTLKPGHLLDKQKGLASLYLIMHKNKKRIVEESKLNHRKAFGKYMKLVKDWSFELNNNYDQEYLLERIRKLGQKNEVSTEVGLIRKMHKGEIKIDANDENEFVPIPVSERYADKEEKKMKIKPRRSVPAFSDPVEKSNEPNYVDMIAEGEFDEIDIDYKMKKKDDGQMEEEIPK